MAGGVFVRKAVAVSEAFKVHFFLKACFVGGVFDIALARDDVALFGSEKGTDVMNGFAVVVVLARQTIFSSLPAFYRKNSARISVIKRLRSEEKSTYDFMNAHICIVCRGKNLFSSISILQKRAKVNRNSHKT